MALLPLDILKRAAPERAERAYPSGAFTLPLNDDSAVAALCLDHAPSLVLEDMLDILEARSLTATIFLREDLLTRHTFPLVERARDEGHEFGLQLVPPSGPRAERPTFAAALARAHGKIGIFAEPRWFRPPHGFMRPDVMDVPLKKWGYAALPRTERRYILGSLPTLPAEVLRGGEDPRARDRTEKLIDDLTGRIGPGSIVVFPASDPDGIPDVNLKSAARLRIFEAILDHAANSGLALSHLTAAADRAAGSQLRLAAPDTNAPW